MADPITPPPELVRHWSRFQGDTDPEALWFRIANEAVQWGADQELEACCEWFTNKFGLEVAADIADLRAARRPKPPNLKKQALADLHEIYTTQPFPAGDSRFNCIRRALEALPDDTAPGD